MTGIVSIGEMDETRPGQVFILWFEDIESVDKAFSCNEQSISKIKPAPTIPPIFVGMAVLLEKGQYAREQLRKIPPLV